MCFLHTVKCTFVAAFSALHVTIIHFTIIIHRLFICNFYYRTNLTGALSFTLSLLSLSSIVQNIETILENFVMAENFTFFQVIDENLAFRGERVSILCIQASNSVYIVMCLLLDRNQHNA